MSDMAQLDAIRQKVANNDYEFTKHAVDRTILRGIAVSEIREAIENGELIEDYPDDKYGPSCLTLGFTSSGRPLHIQITYSSLPVLKLITVYEPDPTEWVDYRSRR
jgi:hypothetical protein